MTHKPFSHIAPTPRLSATLVRLPFGRAAPEGLDYPLIAQVQSHWRLLRGARVAPARAEIDPRPLAEALDVLFIAEIIAPGIARFRLCGQHFTALLGMEPRGMPLSVLFCPESRNDLASAVQQVAQGARVNLPLRAQKGLGRPGIDAMLALMPLTDQHGAMSRILGVLETHGPVGRAPRVFRLAAAVDMAAPARPAGPVALRLIRGGKG